MPTAFWIGFEACGLPPKGYKNVHDSEGLRRSPPRAKKSQAKHPTFLLRTSASAEQMPRPLFVESAVGILVISVLHSSKWD